MRNFVKFLSVLLSLVALTTFAGCAFHVDTTPKTVTPTKEPESIAFEEGETVNVTITMTDGGAMKLKLYPEKAPKTVENFVKLAKEGFYNGLTFHRVISGFIIQGGDPEGTGYGGAQHSIPGEFAENGFAKNDISHIRGVISMARTEDPNSASSQFFIVHDDATFLDGQYAAFGILTEGWDVLDALAATPVDANDAPLAKPVMQSVTVE